MYLFQRSDEHLFWSSSALIGDDDGCSDEDGAEDEEGVKVGTNDGRLVGVLDVGMDVGELVG